MSVPASTVLASPTTDAANEVHPTATGSGNVCEKLAEMTICEPAGLATLPPEIILGILGYLGSKRHWFALARTCQRVSHVVVAELDKYNAKEGQNYAFWYACVANKPAILLRHISHDAAVVNRHFTCNFTIPKLEIPMGQFMLPLAVAIMAGKDGIVQLLLANGADANLPDQAPVSPNRVLWYPINWAAASKNKSSVAIIRMLKDHSADMNQVPKDWIKKRAEYPRGMKCAPIFRVLLLEKPRRTSLRSTQPTSCETYNNDFKKIQDLRLRQLKALLQSGAEPNARYDWDRVTPVFFLLSNLAVYVPSFYFPDRLMLYHEAETQAAMVNDIAASFLDTLRDFGADVHALGNLYYYKEKTARAISFNYPETPLHAVCRLNDRHKPLIYWFLRNGAHIDDLGEAGNTALMAYCGANFKSVDQFQRFLGCRPAINHQDILGRTALHDLCANFWLFPQVKEKVVKMLLDMGADPTVVSGEGHRPGKEIELAIARVIALKSVQNIEQEIEQDIAQDVVLKMLGDAVKEWERLKNEREGRSIHHPGRENHRRGGRGGREGRGGSATIRKENREENRGDERVGCQPANPPGIRGGHRGTRGSDRGHSEAGHHSGLQGSNENIDNDHAKARQNSTSAESHEKEHISQEHNRTVHRGPFYQNARGGRPGSHQGGNRGRGRGRRSDVQHGSRGGHHHEGGHSKGI